MSINIKKKEIAVDFIYYLRVKPMYWLFFKYSISVCPCSKAAFIEEKTHAVYVKKKCLVYYKSNTWRKKLGLIHSCFNRNDKRLSRITSFHPSDPYISLLIYVVVTNWGRIPASRSKLACGKNGGWATRLPFKVSH